MISETVIQQHEEKHVFLLKVKKKKVQGAKMMCLKMSYKVQNSSMCTAYSACRPLHHQMWMCNTSQRSIAKTLASQRYLLLSCHKCF